MADITNIETALNDATELTFSDGAASQTFEFSVPDEKLFVVVRNDDANEATITITAGDFLQNGYGDLEQAVANGEYFIFQLESGICKDEDGEVTVTMTDADGSAFSGTVTDVKIAVVELD
jgi:hypothetical protein